DGAVENGGFLHVSGLHYTVNTAIPSTVQQDELGVWTGGPTGAYRVTNVEILNNETGVYEPLSLTAEYNLAGYNPSDSSGAELAQSIQTAVCQVTGGTDRGVRSADFVVLRETDMSAALVEMGYMSSSGELARLLDTSYQDKLVQGIAE